MAAVSIIPQEQIYPIYQIPTKINSSLFYKRFTMIAFPNVIF